MLSVVFVSYQPFVSYYPPQQEEIWHTKQHLSWRMATQCSDVGLAPKELSCRHAFPSAGATEGK